MEEKVSVSKQSKQQNERLTHLGGGPLSSFTLQLVCKDKS